MKQIEPRPTRPATSLMLRAGAALVCVTLWAASAHAYPYYDDGFGNGCVQCHNQFQGGNGALHTQHKVKFINSDSTKCNLCHPGAGGTTPVRTYWSGAGYGCAGCHGVDYGETSPDSGQPKATSYGLRLYHVSQGVTSCGTTGGCHVPGQNGFPNPFPPVKAENVKPPYYDPAYSTLTDPCASAEEDLAFDADSLGLDNDGNGFRDYPADPNCSAPTTTTTTTSTTTTTLPFDCTAAPAAGCVAPAKGVLLINEKTPGKEKLKLVLSKLQAAVTPGQFGNPVSGSTRYDICVYDAGNQLRGQYGVSRAGQMCGTKPCWALISGKGYKYLDKTTASAGIQGITLIGGDFGKGKIVVVGKNLQSTMPTGVAAALQSQASATVQVQSSDASCFGVGLSNVKKADGVMFSATFP